MCGIVGYVGPADAVPVLLSGLERLEYRGYDSAGIAVLADDGHLVLRKREGKLAELVSELAGNGGMPAGSLGVGHTRWATHGPPTTVNAHPHLDDRHQVVVVHNGIIENYVELREELARKGHRFESDTDTEVVAHAIGEAFVARRDAPSPGDALEAAVRETLPRLDGAYALAVFSPAAPGTLIAARQFSPLVLGFGEGESYIASDIPALLGRTRKVMPLEDGQMAVLTADRISVTTLDGAPVPLAPLEVTWSAEAAEKGGYDHFVRKEIDEQPEAIANTLRGRASLEAVELAELEPLDVHRLRRVYIVAAGSSYYAGLVAKQLVERWARLPVEVAIASEHRYSDPVLGPDTLVVLVTQSGETADTLAALRAAADAGSPTVAVTNVVGSSVTRGADITIFLQVGPEIGVVATKTFTGQLVALGLLAADLGRRLGTLGSTELADLAEGFRHLPAAVSESLALEPQIADLARRLATKKSVFFIGRGFNYPIALEAALKLKEITYLHAEGYPAGELKHGPIAMLEPGWPVVALATPSGTYDKLLSNIEEIKARGAEVIAVAGAGDQRIAALVPTVLRVPVVAETLSPVVNVVPTQLFAYHMAVELGRDVDQPRNLAKSVTVE